MAGWFLLGVHGAIEAEPEWKFMTAVLGTRSTDLTDRHKATVQVADQVHPAGEPLPEYRKVTDRRHDVYPGFRGEGGGGFFATLFHFNWLEFGGQGVSAP